MSALNNPRVKQRIRLSALLLGLLAVAVYVGFIAMTVWSN